jgi:integral membrane protein
MSPRRLFRTVAIAEAITWALLLTGMFLKYVTETTELGVRIGGMLHGIVFVAYVVVTVVVAIDASWSLKRTALGLLAAVPPFFTIWFDLVSERQGALPDRWRLTTSEPAGPLDRLVAWLVRKPLQGVAVGVVAVAALTGAALLVGPPTS